MNGDTQEGEGKVERSIVENGENFIMSQKAQLDPAMDEKLGQGWEESNPDIMRFLHEVALAGRRQNE